MPSRASSVRHRLRWRRCTDCSEVSCWEGVEFALGRRKTVDQVGSTSVAVSEQEGRKGYVIWFDCKWSPSVAACPVQSHRGMPGS